MTRPAPVVTLTAPTAGARVHGIIALTVNATDNIGVVSVRYKMNGTLLGAVVTTPPFSLAWDTTATADGAYTIKAVARDAAGNTKGSPGVAVTVSNGRVTVLWSQLVNATVVGQRLSKTGGCDGCADAGAVSAQTIATDGYFEFRATEASSLRLVGLGNSGAGTVTDTGQVRLPTQARGHRRGKRERCVSCRDHIRFRRHLPDHDRRRGHRLHEEQRPHLPGCPKRAESAARARGPVLDTLHDRGRGGLHSVVTVLRKISDRAGERTTRCEGAPGSAARAPKQQRASPGRPNQASISPSRMA